MLDQLAMTADVGRRDKLPLRHRLQRLQRRHQLRQPHRLSRIGENVDQRIITLDLVMRHAADEMDSVRCGRKCRLRLQRLLHRPAADEQRSEEHTSELQSLMRTSYPVFCLKKKK